MFLTNPFFGKQEGFGEQYKIIIFYMIYSELINIQFVYSPFKEVAHNYDNDPEFINKLENIIGLKNTLLNYDENTHEIQNHFVADVHHYLHNNMESFEKSKSLQIIKECFYKNKTNPYLNVNFNEKMSNDVHIAIHIRRSNPHDNGNYYGGLNIPDDIYIQIINTINNFNDLTSKNKIFHIFSQGSITDFEIYSKFSLEHGINIKFHLNESLESTFINMVYADILVVSASALSYVAGILSNNTIYYINHCNPPLPSWNIIQGYNSPRMYHKFNFVLPSVCVYYDSKTGEYIIRKDMINLSPLKII